MDFIFVAVGGFIGAILRVELSRLLLPLYPELIFPYPTLIINLLGSFVLAFFLGYTDFKNEFSKKIKLAISTGLLGSFTTFSTFSVEALHLFQINELLFAVLYVFFSFSGGFLFSWLGLKTINFLYKQNLSSRGGIK